MEEYKKLFDEVASMLGDAGYDVAVEQVKEELLNGRLTDERIQTLSDAGPRSSSGKASSENRKGASADFVRRHEYSEAEALTLILEAAKRAIVEPTAMVGDIFAFLSEYSVQAVTLESEGALNQRSTLLINNVDRQLAKSHADQIDRLNKNIRES